MLAISKVIDFALIKAYRLMLLLKNELLTKNEFQIFLPFFIPMFCYLVKINADVKSCVIVKFSATGFQLKNAVFAKIYSNIFLTFNYVFCTKIE